MPKGQNTTTSGVNPDIQGLRNSMVGYLMGQGKNNMGPPEAQIASWGTGQVGGQSMDIGQGMPQQQSGPLGGQMMGDPVERMRSALPMQGTPEGGGGMFQQYTGPQVNSQQQGGGQAQQHQQQGQAAGQDMSWMNQPGAVSPQYMQQGGDQPMASRGGDGPQQFMGGMVDSQMGMPQSRAGDQKRNMFGRMLGERNMFGGRTLGDRQHTAADPMRQAKQQGQQDAQQGQFNQMMQRGFAQEPGLPGQVQVGGPANIQQLGQVGVNGQARDVGFGQGATDDFMNQFERVKSGAVRGQQIDAGQFQDPNAPGFDRGQVRDVNAQGTQSVDQLGGANSAFFQNMMQQLQPAFNQQRQLAAAQGAESAGNLTGSGMANRLGGALNRSLGDEQARLADYATQGLGMEVNRQGQDAGRNLQGQMSNQGADISTMQQLMGNQQFGSDQRLRALMANQGTDLSAQQGNQQAGLTSGMANQDARLRAAGMGQQGELANMDAMIRSGGMNQNADLERMRMDMQGQLANQGTDLQRLMANQSTAAGRAGQQATMDQQRNMGIYGQQSQNASQNAQNFLQMLMGMGTTGVGPPQTNYQPGFMDFLGGIGGQLVGGLAGGGF
jgi:hypothetical protein